MENKCSALGVHDERKKVNLVTRQIGKLISRQER